MKERNVNRAKEERERIRSVAHGGVVFRLYSHSGSEPFNPPPLYSFELFRGCGSFYGSNMIKGSVSGVNSAPARGTFNHNFDQLKQR